MSLLEWLGESIDPGDIGSVKTGARPRGPRTRRAIIGCFVFASLLVGLWMFVLWALLYPHSIAGRAIWSVLTLLYLTISYYVHPRPDMSNVGFIGGLVDHPLRWSDDINRLLIYLDILLEPGRFVAESTVDMFMLLKYARTSTS